MKQLTADNKMGANYYGHLSRPLRTKRGSLFKAISDRFVFKSSADLAFGKGAESMLKNKELNIKQQDIIQIEGDWSKAQKDIVRSKLSLAHTEIGMLAREQSKN